MPYHSDGSKIKNPTRGQRAAYHKQKSQANQIRKAATKHSENPHTRLYGGSNVGGASIGGGSSA